MTIQDTQDHIEEELSERLTKLPLTDRFFGKLARMRLELGEFRRSPIWGWVCSERLEHRLERIGNTPALGLLIQEMGNIKQRDEFDRRLQDAWAEIRVVDQLMRERFIDIEKVTVSADFVARQFSRCYAIQVTRIHRGTEFQDTPVGKLDDIYDQSKDSIRKYFLRSLRSKNSSFRDAYTTGYTRRITIVTSIERLQDSLNRHIACRRIKQSILRLKQRNFDEVQWLLDNGNGAIFWVETDGGNERVRCLCDWGDDPS